MENFIESQENEEQLSLQEYLRVFYAGRWIIVISFVVVLLATAYYTFTANPVYEANTTILVDTQGSAEQAIFGVNYLNPQSTYITNQVEILKSRTLAERVIIALEASAYRDSLDIFKPNSDGEYLALRDQVDWLVAHLEILPKQDTDIIGLTFSAGSAFQAASICNEIAKTFQQINKEYNLSEFKDLRRFLEFQLRKKSEELKTSEDVLKIFQETEELVSLDDRTKELIDRVSDAQAQLEGTLISLESLQEQKRNYEKQFEERRELFSKDVKEISNPLIIELQAEYARLVSDKVKYESLIAQQSSIDPLVYELELNSKSERIKAVQRRLQEEAQQIMNSSMISDPLGIAQKLIEAILDAETQIKVASAKVNALREVVDKYEGEFADLPGQGLELVRLQRQVQVDQNTYILLIEKLEETKITEAGQKEKIRIVDEAIEPRYPVSPKKRLNLLLGAIIGIGLGIGLTFLKEYFDDSIKNPELLEKMGFPILAIIPKIILKEIKQKVFANNGKQELEMTEGNGIESRLVAQIDPKSPISESYRTLRTNIQFQKLRKKESTIMVTSSTPKEGKSTTLANLAITMAQMGGRILMVDTDLRRPVLHSVFNLKKDRGITNFLMGKLKFDDIVKPTFVDNLYAVTSGPLPPNPSELLSSEEMDEFIEIAKQKFDVVLFDSPPIIAVTDAAILSTKIEGLILVIRAHQTQKTAISRAKNLLDKVSSNIVGCVLNGVEIERAYGSYYYYYYYHYYSYYGHDLKRRKKPALFKEKENK